MYECLCHELKQTSSNEIEMDNRVEYYKFLNKIFPSNYSKNKIQKVKRQRLKSPEKTKIVTKNKTSSENNSHASSLSVSDEEKSTKYCNLRNLLSSF